MNQLEAIKQFTTVVADTGAFNAKLQESGAWVFAGGLEFPNTAKVVRRRDGALERTDGP